MFFFYALIQPEQVLCVDRKFEKKTQRVKKGQFTLKGLSPFTTYVCTLEHSGLQVVAMTLPDRKYSLIKPVMIPPCPA